LGAKEAPIDEKQRAREELRKGGNAYECLRRLGARTTVTYQVSEAGRASPRGNTHAYMEIKKPRMYFKTTC
jgi:hypothetical protein